MLCSKIMVAYDGSSASKASLNKAAQMACVCGAEIIVIHVTVSQTAGDETYAVLADSDYADGLKNETDEILKDYKGRHRFISIIGMSPSFAILEQAKENKCDMIIMGSRGLTGIKEFLGSVSHSVVQHARIPVMIVKDETDE